jgi:hypothetical protein
VLVGAPHFFIQKICPGLWWALADTVAADPDRVSLRREVADIRADVPGGRVRRIVRQDARTLQTDKVKGGIQMAKKAAKGAKKKAAKKK